MKDSGSIPGLGRSPGEGNGNPLQYSCLKNPRTEEFGRLQSMGSQRVRHNWATEHAHMVYCASAWKPTSDFAFISMPGELRKYRDLRERILSLLLRSQCHNCFLFKTQQSFPGTHSRLWSPKCNFGFSQGVEYSSLCCTVGRCYSSAVNVIICIY